MAKSATKRVSSMILAATMMLSTSISAFATTGTTVYTDTISGVEYGLTHKKKAEH